MTIPISTSLIIVFVLFCFAYLHAYCNRKWFSMSSSITLIIFAFLVIASVFAPAGFDKKAYIRNFHNVTAFSDGKDPGWTLLQQVLHVVCFDNEIAYLFVVCTIYVLGFYVLAHYKLGKEHIAYFLLLTAGCLGFWNGSTNIMRIGVATSLFFISLCVEENNKVAYYALSIAAFFIHNSVLVLVLGYILTKRFNDFKLYIWIWLFFLVLSAVNALDFVVHLLSDHFGIVGDRLAQYAYGQDDDVAKVYRNAGFRIDFILYSSFAILYSWWVIFKQNYNDVFFTRLSCTYVLSNCLFLTMIRVPYADRFAMLGWVLIPMIILYPYMNPYNKLEFNPRAVIAAFVPVALMMILSFR